jgi:hypothetical protein
MTDTDSDVTSANARGRDPGLGRTPAPTAATGSADLGADGQGAMNPESSRTISRAQRGLGWFSIGLGLAQLVAPQKLARLIGVSDEQRTHKVLRAIGLRELAVGIGILSRRRPARWLWGRVAGDAIDIGLLGMALRSRGAMRIRIGVALAAVAGVTLLDAWAGRGSSRLSPEIDSPSH